MFRRPGTGDLAASARLRALLSEKRDSLIFIGVALLAFSFTVALLAPGYFAHDSGLQLEQARNFEFYDDHPILMALIWHYTDLVIPGPLGMLALISGLYWFGLAGVLWHLPAALSVRVVSLLVIGFYPPVSSTLPILLKDTLMHGALLVAIAFLLARGGALRLLFALVFVLVAIGVRHNAAAAAWPLLALPLMHLPFLARRPRWLALPAAAAMGLVATFLLTLGLGRALAPLTHKTEFWQTIPTFDLSGMSLKLGELLVEPEAGLLAPEMGLDEIALLYRPEYSPTLNYCIWREGRCIPLFRLTQDPEELALLRDNWLRALAEHPAVYFAHRLEIMEAQLGIRGGAVSLYFLDGQPHHPLALDYPVPNHTLKVMAWLDRQVRRSWFKPWVYAALSCILLPFSVLRYRREADPLPLSYLLSGLSYLMSLFLTTSSSDHRYTVWAILCSMLALVTLLLPAAQLSRNRALAQAGASPGAGDRLSRRRRGA